MKNYIFKIIISIVLYVVFVASAILLANATSALWSIKYNILEVGSLWTKNGAIIATILSIIIGIISLIFATNIIMNTLKDCNNKKQNSTKD